MTARILTWLVCGVFVAATSASAQTSKSSKPPAPKRDRELSLGGGIFLPASMGTAEATLLGSDGSPSLTLFRTENSLATGFGPEVTWGFQLRPGVWVELAGGLVFADLRTRITDDFENAPVEILKAPVMRVSGEGAVLWYFARYGKTELFVRGSGGIMRETAGQLSVAEAGFLGSGGVGLKRWWRTGGKGTFKRVGLRAEFRAVFRGAGISLSDRSVTFGPAGTVHVVFGY